MKNLSAENTDKVTADNKVSEGLDNSEVDEVSNKHCTRHRLGRWRGWCQARFDTLSGFWSNVLTDFERILIVTFSLSLFVGMLLAMSSVHVTAAIVELRAIVREVSFRASETIEFDPIDSKEISISGVCNVKVLPGGGAKMFQEYLKKPLTPARPTVRFLAPGYPSLNSLEAESVKQVSAQPQHNQSQPTVQKIPLPANSIITLASSGTPKIYKIVLESPIVAAGGSKKASEYQTRSGDCASPSWDPLQIRVKANPGVRIFGLKENSDSTEKFEEIEERPVTFQFMADRVATIRAHFQPDTRLLGRTAITGLDMTEERFSDQGKWTPSSVVSGTVVFRGYSGYNQEMLAGEEVEVDIGEGALRDIVLNGKNVDIQFAGRIHNIERGSNLSELKLGEAHYESLMPTLFDWCKADNVCRASTGLFGTALAAMIASFFIYSRRRYGKKT